jgi:aspartyl-tRNA(Asn)/glutamyl-tRNA(Gln) amidotransferase subunit A/fatty acid amide hydrolase 2
MTGETVNLRYGRTRNPLDTSRVAGGSTGGEGALVGSGSTAFGMGSDILGSIRFPAAFCGTVGFKPSSAAVDKSGTWPVVKGFCDSWLTLGPLTRSVRDARLVYDVIARQPLPPAAPPAGLRLVIPRGFPQTFKAACIRQALERAESELLSAGLVRQEHQFAGITKLFLDIPRMIVAEHYDDWLRQLTTVAGERFSVGAELFRQLTRRPSVEPGFFLWLVMGATMRPGEKATQGIIARYRVMRADVQQMLGNDGILLLPTVGMLAPKHGAMNRQSMRPGPNGTVTSMTFCNYCDLPAITIPAWQCADPKTGLPPAVMLACAPGAEARLLDAAMALEAAIS